MRKKKGGKGGTLSAFLLYYQKNVKTLMKNQTKTLHGSELVKLASAKWAEMKDEDKKIYHQQAKSMRE